MLEVFIGRLRKKLDPDGELKPIETVRGRGDRFAIPRSEIRMAWRTLSLNSRQLLAASLGLVAFLGLTGYALDRAFQETALSNLRQRLDNYSRAYLRNSDFDAEGRFKSPDASPPDPRFDRPGSGLYAVAAGKGFRWESASTLGTQHSGPGSDCTR